MSEIMENSGFADQKTFNRVFRELVNMTPREYRRCEDDSERTNLKRDFSVHGYRNWRVPGKGIQRYCIP